MKTEVWVTLQVEGTHSWPKCPFEEVAFLRDTHRHIFHIKAYKEVTHTDRDVEFIMLKREILDYLHFEYTQCHDGAETRTVHTFGPKSCEMIATELIEEFELSRCSVSEDLENGAIVYAH